MTDIRIFLDHPHAEMPSKATPGSAGYDLHAIIDENDDVTLFPGDRMLVSTGLRVALPAGWEMQIRPRSGLAVKHGLTVLNSPGTIDEDFRGVVGVCLINHGRAPVTIRTGDRIAQAVFAPIPRSELVEVDSAAELGATDRGEGGFGSTGTRSE